MIVLDGTCSAKLLRLTTLTLLKPIIHSISKTGPGPCIKVCNKKKLVIIRKSLVIGYNISVDVSPNMCMFQTTFISREQKRSNKSWKRRDRTKKNQEMREWKKKRGSYEMRASYRCRLFIVFWLALVVMPSSIIRPVHLLPVTSDEGESFVTFWLQFGLLHFNMHLSYYSTKQH